MPDQPKPFGIQLKPPGVRSHSAPCVVLGEHADTWDGVLTCVDPVDIRRDHWSVLLPHHCEEWVIATGTREHALAEARRFRDELDLAIAELERGG